MFMFILRDSGGDKLKLHFLSGNKQTWQLCGLCLRAVTRDGKLGHGCQTGSKVVKQTTKKFKL